MSFLSKLYFKYLHITNKSIVKIPKWIKVIPSGTFNEMSNLRKIYFSSNIKEIQPNALTDCKNLKELYFEDEVDFIFYNSFSVNKNVKIYFSEKVSEVAVKKITQYITKNTDKKIDLKLKRESFVGVVEENSKMTESKSEQTAEDEKIVREEMVEEISEPTEPESEQTVKDKEIVQEEIFEEIPEPTESELKQTAENEETVQEKIFEEISEPTESEPKWTVEDEETVQDKIVEENSKMTESKPEQTAEDEKIVREEIVEEISEPTEPEPVYEDFGELIIKTNEKKVKSEPTRKNKIREKNRINIQEYDRKEFASAISLTDITTNNKFLSSLIERYKLLENKYGACFPIGMLDVSKEEYSLLAAYVKKYIQESSDITLLISFICTVFLIKTAENYYINRNFWTSVSTLLKYTESESTVYLKKALLRFCISEKKYFRYYENRRSFAGTVMIHTVIDSGSLVTVMNFIRDFYIEEMNETYSSSLAGEIINLFIDEMAKDSAEKSEVNGIYRLPYNFKNACREFREPMQDILKCLFFNVDAYYHRKSDASYSPAFSYKIFNRWRIKDLLYAKKNSVLPAQPSKNNTSVPRKFKQVEKLVGSRKCSYFIDEDYSLYLYIPQFDVPSELSGDNIKLRIFNSSTELTKYNRECEVIGIFRFHTDEMTVKLDGFYKELSIKIVTENGEIIFDSKSQLSRTKIIFDNNLTEYSFKKIPDERFYILTHRDDEFFADANYNSYKNFDYVIHSLDVEDDCIITVNNNNLFKIISEETDVQLSVDSSFIVRKTVAFFSGREYRIYTKTPEICISCEAEKSDEYIIDVNDIHMDISTILGEKENLKLILSELTKENFVSVVLRKKGTLRHLHEWNIAVLENFEYSIDKDYYYNDKNAYLEDIYADNVNFDIAEYPCTFPLNRSRRININASIGEKEFYIEIKMPVIYWEANDKYNSFSGRKYISVSELKNVKSVFVDIPVDNVQIMAVNENMNRIVSISNGKADISDFKISNSESTSFGIVGRKIGQLELFEIIYYSAIRELNVSCTDSELMISYIRIGVCPVCVNITDRENNSVFSKKYYSFDDENVVISENISQIPDGRYTAEISMMKTDDFGFSTANKIIGSYKFIKGNPIEIYLNEKNNLFKPDYSFGDDERNKVNNFYCENIQKSDSESEIYTADAYFYNKYRKKIYITDANPVRIEFLEKNEKYLTFTLTDKDGDGFLYEKARGYLVSDISGSRDYYSYKLPDHYAIKI